MAAVAAAAVVVVASFAIAWRLFEGPPYEQGGPVAHRLETFLRNSKRGTVRRLDLMTPFSWDKVYLFNEYTRYRSIDAVTGTKHFDRDGYFQGNYHSLLVFVKGQKVVHAVAPEIIMSTTVNGIPKKDALVRAVSPRNADLGDRKAFRK